MLHRSWKWIRLMVILANMSVLGGCAVGRYVAPVPSVISVTVTDAQTGAPITNAVVIVTSVQPIAPGQPREVVLNDPTGQGLYTLYDVGGVYDISIEASGYVSQSIRTKWIAGTGKDLAGFQIALELATASASG